MVDAQFTDDKYVDSESRNREALAEANRRAAERERLAPKPKSRAEVMSERAKAIQQAGMAAEHDGKIVLDEFSKFTPNGEIISVDVKRLSPQELLAGDLLPISARKFVAKMIELGTEATKAERGRVGLPELTEDRIMNEVFEGDHMAAVEAYTQMVNAICIACVRDPDIRLYWDERAKGNDPNGLVVSVIPFKDREKISNWALNVEEAAAKTVEPFLQQSAAANEVVSAVAGRNGEAQRANQV